MASLTVSPAAPNTGDLISILGSEFTPSAVVTVSIPETGYAAEIVADEAGFFGSDDVANHATSTLTSSGVNVTAGKVIVVNTTTYTFRSTFSTGPTVANEIKIGSDAAATLANIKKAINGTGVAGTDYSVGTVAHTTVAAHTLTATTLLVYARTGGTGGNTYPSTTDETTLSWTGADFANTGSAASGVSSMLVHFESPGTYEITANDGTLAAVTATVRVFEG